MSSWVQAAVGQAVCPASEGEVEYTISRGRKIIPRRSPNPTPGGVTVAP